MSYTVILFWNVFDWQTQIDQNFLTRANLNYYFYFFLSFHIIWLDDKKENVLWTIDLCFWPITDLLVNYYFFISNKETLKAFFFYSKCPFIVINFRNSRIDQVNRVIISLIFYVRSQRTFNYLRLLQKKVSNFLFFGETVHSSTLNYHCILKSRYLRIHKLIFAKSDNFKINSKKFSWIIKKFGIYSFSFCWRQFWIEQMIKTRKKLKFKFEIWPFKGKNIIFKNVKKILNLFFRFRMPTWSSHWRRR